MAGSSPAMTVFVLFRRQHHASDHHQHGSGSDNRDVAVLVGHKAAQQVAQHDGPLNLFRRLKQTELPLRAPRRIFSERALRERARFPQAGNLEAQSLRVG